MQRDIVKFEKGAVLHKEMLESIYNYPRIMCESYFAGYSDGILYGLEWLEKDGKHYITSGALKYKGEIYFQPENIAIEDKKIDFSEGQRYYIYFKEFPEENSYSRKVFKLDISFEEEPIENGFCYKYIKYEMKIKSLDNIKLFGIYASPESDSFCIPSHIIKNDILPVITKKSTKAPP